MHESDPTRRGLAGPHAARGAMPSTRPGAARRVCRPARAGEPGRRETNRRRLAGRCRPEGTGHGGVSQQAGVRRGGEHRRPTADAGRIGVGLVRQVNGAPRLAGPSIGEPVPVSEPGGQAGAGSAARAAAACAAVAGFSMRAMPSARRPAPADTSMATRNRAHSAGRAAAAAARRSPERPPGPRSGRERHCRHAAGLQLAREGRLAGLRRPPPPGTRNSR